MRLGLQLRGAPRAEQEEKVAFWLERLDIAALRDHYPAQISGGQRQRTAIARTLVFQPNLLLMDEPFNSLDALTREHLQNVVLELIQEHGLTTVLVTHNIEEAVFLGQRVLVLAQPPTRRHDDFPRTATRIPTITAPHRRFWPSAQHSVRYWPGQVNRGCSDCSRAYTVY